MIGNDEFLIGDRVRVKLFPIAYSPKANDYVDGTSPIGCRATQTSVMLRGKEVVVTSRGGIGGCMGKEAQQHVVVSVDGYEATCFWTGWLELVECARCQAPCSRCGKKISKVTYPAALMLPELRQCEPPEVMSRHSVWEEIKDLKEKLEEERTALKESQGVAFRIRADLDRTTRGASDGKREAEKIERELRDQVYVLSKELSDARLTIARAERTFARNEKALASLVEYSRSQGFRLFAELETAVWFYTAVLVWIVKAARERVRGSWRGVNWCRVFQVTLFVVTVTTSWNVFDNWIAALEERRYLRIPTPPGPTRESEPWIRWDEIRPRHKKWF